MKGEGKNGGREVDGDYWKTGKAGKVSKSPQDRGKISSGLSVGRYFTWCV